MCPGSVWTAHVRLGSGLVRIRVPKPRKNNYVVASVCFSLGLGVCLFYAQQGESTAVVIRAWFVRMNMWTYLPRCAYWLNGEMKLVPGTKKWKSKINQKPKKTTTEAAVQRTHAAGTRYQDQWLSEKTKQKGLNAKPRTITNYRCTQVIISQKRVRFFTANRVARVVFFYFIPGCTRFLLQTDRVYPFFVCCS